ncbi:DeoR/GlpR family DNA-binding transcription regulator [Niveispirillum sp. KHB5.9]|uniref:DeoR/GlpR family DNA-binding transcription regulator n=1 Tax=Niveispirillum sp. KHB5.9 TaxID=3400269 RepID=UPI003A85446D
MTDIPLARRDIIAGRLAQGQAVVAAALAVEFAVSEDAIRRDLRALAADGLCRRVYGGALPITPGAGPMSARMGEEQDRKRLLARAAASLIQPGEFLFIDNGSTNLALVEFLPDLPDLTVATNSIDIATVLLRRPEIRLIMVGGAVDPIIGGAVDAMALQAVERMNINRCFLGACSISAAMGISTVDFADATLKRVLISVSATCVAMVTSDKLDTRSPHRVTPVARLGRLVVEHDAPCGMVAALEQAGATIMMASAGPVFSPAL